MELLQIGNSLKYLFKRYFYKPTWWNGRHDRLKICFLLKKYRFKSDSGYKIKEKEN